MYNTLSATMWLSMIAVLVFIIYLIFIHAIIVVGFAIGIFFVGIILLVGPSTPHISNLLIASLMDTDFENLTEEDYVYIKLANDSILQWIRVLMFFGFGFVLIAPLGDAIPMFLSSIITTFTMIFILNPAFSIMQFSVVLAIFYIASVLPLFIICIRQLILIIRKKTSTKKSPKFPQV
jgi:hypothetical protein